MKTIPQRSIRTTNAWRIGINAIEPDRESLLDKEALAEKHKEYDEVCALKSFIFPPLAAAPCIAKPYCPFNDVCH